MRTDGSGSTPKGVLPVCGRWLDLLAGVTLAPRRPGSWSSRQRRRRRRLHQDPHRAGRRWRRHCRATRGTAAPTPGSTRRRRHARAPTAASSWAGTTIRPGSPWGLIETQNGTTWTDTEAPQPENAGSGSEQGLWIGSRQCGIYEPCHAVSCPNASILCGRRELPRHRRVLAAPGRNDVRAGTGAQRRLRCLRTPGPTAGPSIPTCSSSRSTAPRRPRAWRWAATGTRAISTRPLHRHALRRDAGARSPRRSRRTPPPGRNSFGSTLNGISCPSTTSCAAAGVYQDNASGNQPNGLLVTLANGDLDGAARPGAQRRRQRRRRERRWPSWCRTRAPRSRPALRRRHLHRQHPRAIRA